MLAIGELAEIGKRWGGVVVVGVVGLVLVGYGVWESFGGAQDRAVVEIVGDGNLVNGNVEHGNEERIVVDVGGAVESPGVYTLASGSRIGEALSAAGGLAASADRTWVTRYVNLAEEVKDGGKIFIPPEGNENVVDDNIVNGNIEHGNEGKVNINTASVSELDSLWGIGEARAKQIIDNRPYAAVEELTSKAGIPSNVYETIKDEVSVY